MKQDLGRGYSSPIVNAMTVDVEDYFQVSAFDAVVSRDDWGRFGRRVVDNTDRLLSLFAEHGVRATFFVLGWLAEREPDLVKRIAGAGHEIASHGQEHRLVYDQTPEEFAADVSRAKATLEALCGRPVLGYRAPSYSITARSLWAFRVLAEAGFAYDASVFPIHHDRYGMPGAQRHQHFVATDGTQLLEVPASTVRIGRVNLPIAGGGYFRLLPYRWIAWGISHVNRSEQRPVVFYVHPWEIDAAQPKLAGPVLSRFRHYRNLKRTEPRLRRLLGQFRFDTIEHTILPGARLLAGGNAA